MDWGVFLTNLINSSLIVAILTGAVSLVVVMVQKDNKKKEIDYINENEIKKQIRKYAVEIVDVSNVITSNILTYVDLIDKEMQVENGSWNITSDREHDLTIITNQQHKCIDDINAFSIKMIRSLTNFELLFPEYKSRDLKKDNEFQSIVLTDEISDIIENLKSELVNIQLGNTESSNKLEELRVKLDKLVREFILSTRSFLGRHNFKF